MTLKQVRHDGIINTLYNHNTEVVIKTQHQTNNINNMKRKLNWMTILFLGLLFLFFIFYIFPSYQSKLNDIASKKVQVLDTRFSYTKNEVLQLFKDLKIEGKEKVKFISGVVDMIYPLIYGILLFLLMSKVTSYFSNKKLKIICLLPLIGMLFDYVENFSVLNMLNSYPNISETQVFISSSATSLKWLFLYTSTLLILVLTVIKLFKTFLKKIKIN